MSIKSVVLLLMYAHLAKSCGYYWRPYEDGQIPHDAVPGGHDSQGIPTYIGQVYDETIELLPGTLVNGSEFITTSSYGSSVQKDLNIKILCSDEPYNFQWIDTQAGNISGIPSECNVVDGGYEVKNTLHIGRVLVGLELIIGKVFSFRVGGYGLWTPSGSGEVHYTTYQLLVFDCC